MQTISWPFWMLVKLAYRQRTQQGRGLWGVPWAQHHRTLGSHPSQDLRLHSLSDCTPFPCRPRPVDATMGYPVTLFLFLFCSYSYNGPSGFSHDRCTQKRFQALTSLTLAAKTVLVPQKPQIFLFTQGQEVALRSQPWPWTASLPEKQSKCN